MVSENAVYTVMFSLIGLTVLCWILRFFKWIWRRLVEIGIIPLIGLLLTGIIKIVITTFQWIGKKAEEHYQNRKDIFSKPVNPD